MKKFSALFGALMLVCLLFVLALGCQKEEPTPLPSAKTPATPATQALTGTPLTPTAGAVTKTPTSTPVATATLTPAPTAAGTPVAAGAPLNIVSPEPESVVQTRSVTIKGSTSPDAVLTIGEKNIEVDEAGNFSVVVALVEGPNIIEVISSQLFSEPTGKAIVVICIA